MSFEYDLWLYGRSITLRIAWDEGCLYHKAEEGGIYTRRMIWRVGIETGSTWLECLLDLSNPIRATFDFQSFKIKNKRKNKFAHFFFFFSPLWGVSSLDRDNRRRSKCLVHIFPLVNKMKKKNPKKIVSFARVAIFLIWFHLFVFLFFCLCAFVQTLFFQSHDRAENVIYPLVCFYFYFILFLHLFLWFPSV